MADLVDQLIEEAVGILRPDKGLERRARTQLREMVEWLAAGPSSKADASSGKLTCFAAVAGRAAGLREALPANGTRAWSLLHERSAEIHSARLGTLQQQEVATVLMGLLRSGRLSVLVEQLSTVAGGLADDIGAGAKAGHPNDHRMRVRQFIMLVADVADRCHCDAPPRPQTKKFLRALRCLYDVASEINPRLPPTKDLNGVAREMLPRVRDKRERAGRDEPLDQKREVWRNMQYGMPTGAQLTPRAQRYRRQKLVSAK